MHPKIERLPLLAEICRTYSANSKQNFFARFPQRLDFSERTFSRYEMIEKCLSYIPKSEWGKFRDRVGELSNLRMETRHWERLHDALNESLGARILTEEFRCSSLVFEPNKEHGKTPDWRGMCGEVPHYAEVKTINHSDEECKSWLEELELVHFETLPPGLKSQLTSAYKLAISQLGSPEDSSTARKIVILFVNCDRNLEPVDGDLTRLFGQFLSEIELPDYLIRFTLKY